MKTRLISPIPYSLVALAMLSPACGSLEHRPTPTQHQAAPADPFAGVQRYEEQTKAMPPYVGSLYRNGTCRLSFLKPTGWTVIATPRSAVPHGCDFELVRDAVLEASSEETGPSGPVPSIYISVLWQPINAAVLDAGFHNIEGRWHVEPDPQSGRPSRIDLPHGGTGLCRSSTSNPAGGRPRASFFCVLGTPSISVTIGLDEDDLTIGERLISTLAFLPPDPV